MRISDWSSDVCSSDLRPHEALGQATPSDCYDPPPRPYSGHLREPEYPDGHQVRRVRSNGEIKWHSKLVFLSEVLIGEPDGREETEEGTWAVRYGPVELGSIDAQGKFSSEEHTSELQTLMRSSSAV